jgi:RNA polymerase sigma-B factor
VSTGQQQTAAQTREHLIESHLPLVKAVARRYAGPNAELDDLVQVGAVGLIKASDRFDPGKGVAFATFATPTIEGEIRHHLRDRSSALRIPRELQRLARKIHRCQGELAVKLGRTPTAAEVAAELEISEDEVEQAIAAGRARDAVPLAADTDASDAAEETSSGSDNRLTLASSLRSLDDRERRIVYLRFHADKTERQIAREMGISQAHVSRLLSGALTKLRDGLENGGDTTPETLISPDSQAQKGRNRPQKHETRQTGASGRRGRPQPVADVELRTAIERWLASEGGGGHPADGAARGAESGAAAGAASGAPKDAADGSDRKSGSSHSGRFLVRMPSTLHEQLAQAAERDQVSLNRFVTDALATTVSPAPDDQPANQPPPVVEATDGGPPPARTIRMVIAANLAVVVVSVAVAGVLLVLALQRGI